MLTDHQAYAVLSQHLALDINTPQYLFNSESPLDAMRLMHVQIANHMRVCVAVGNGIESLRGVASSEPILSEAASRSSFFIYARDSVVYSKPRQAKDWFCCSFSVTELFSHLFSDSTFDLISDCMPSLCSSENQRSFKEEFDNAKMHFNHFIKPHEQKVLARRYLLAFMARGAAALGANC
jgi:hypothetical protein